MDTFLRLASVALSILFTACSSTPTATPVVSSQGPEWTRAATRNVDNGYIVYVGHAEASSLDTAQFKAEGLALEDLANECSIIPKGTRLEDRYSEKISTGYSAYVKVALEMQDCEHATKANDPVEIRRIANVPFTEQLKRYQETNETGQFPEDVSADKVASLDFPPPPVQGKTSDEVHFYVTRQYIAQQKEVVILAPPTSFASGSPESQHFLNTVQPATNQVAGMVQSHPDLARHPTPWSRLPDRPRAVSPSGMIGGMGGARGIHTPPKPNDPRASAHGGSHRSRRRGRH